MRIALATCETLPKLFTDDQMLAKALEARGVEAYPLVWSSAQAETDAPDLCILRNTWDYYFRPQEFLAWAEGMAARSTLLNPFPLVRWNHHKGYLLKLAAARIPTVPTILVKQGKDLDIALFAGAAAWDEVVVKPAISAGAHRTGRYAADNTSAQTHLGDLTRDGDALLQPYLRSVEHYGERSFIFIDGAFTHGVRRTQALKDGVGLERIMVRVEPTEAELKLAQDVLAALPTPTLYARVDLAPDEHGNPVLMEVEVIEPRLFLQECPEALEALADALMARASAGRNTAADLGTAR